MMRIRMTRTRLCALALSVAAAIAAAPAAAADNGALARDLTATISLLGLPCGQVVSVVTQGDRDHLATCSNGIRYRVYVNPQGKVAAEKR